MNRFCTIIAEWLNVSNLVFVCTGLLERETVQCHDCPHTQYMLHLYPFHSFRAIPLLVFLGSRYDPESSDGGDIGLVCCRCLPDAGDLLWNGEDSSRPPTEGVVRSRWCLRSPLLSIGVGTLPSRSSSSTKPARKVSPLVTSEPSSRAAPFVSLLTTQQC